MTAALAGACGLRAPRAGAVVCGNVSTQHTHQTIDNFGASGAWTMDPLGQAWSETAKNRIADLLFSQQKGIGLSLWRFNIGAGGAYTDKDTVWHPWRAVECFKAPGETAYDWSRHAGQRWFLRAARSRGVRQFLAFACSPPVWLTKNGKAHCTPDVGTTNLRHGGEGAYAAFLADVAEHLVRAERIPVIAVSPINEPNWKWEGGQEGCRYASDEIARVVLALDGELRRRKLRVHADAPDAGELPPLLSDAAYQAWSKTGPTGRYWCENVTLGGKYREYAHDLLGSADVRRALNGRISAHSYWCDRGDSRLRDLRRAVRSELNSIAPGLRYWMTEYCVMEHKRDLGMDTALRVARVIHHDLTDANASAWHWWLAVSPADYKDGLIYVDWVDGKDGAIHTSKTLWMLGNFSRFVRPGARRVECTPSESDGLLLSAYTGPGRRLSIIAVNEGEEREMALTLDVPVRGVRVYETSASRDLEPVTGTHSTQALPLPARSVMTFTMDRC